MMASVDPKQRFIAPCERPADRAESPHNSVASNAEECKFGKLGKLSKLSKLSR